MARSDASDIREIRNYAGQVQRIASALSEDKDFAKRLIDAAAQTKTITVTVGIGPFSISVTVKKESK